MNMYIIISIGVVASAFLFQKYRKQVVEIYTIREFIHAKNGAGATSSMWLEKFFKEPYATGPNYEKTEDDVSEDGDGDGGE
ncbi:hypothetical protein H8R29_19975 [Priestia megaterium]|uniref:Uncharacterized protein n=1 Tax=Priestia megaterium (strain ATCC 14581 / DSM 32 / CCUG 1817 / JCM 2506 / NBRC 15308 / NCIMB 9376 / NCTC 10342 / NRRL B-14308 / VKM B-512 / Ford 19) TaxID=1348623 RepID=A0A0B6AMF3_PRIM2|nr:hypothetical protein [Priestia megaterium]AJI22272.1 hypothetical protein BG04_723 [Priestia megaterium NBRC 15308 = ATCC 14581]KFN06024.1 hypothetical protein DJ91_4272 [Priestia megaterium]KGJ82489.1 hypothetical protein BMT_14465 [Priestia megaterium NBRC 15308 = ATCC 14581]MDR4231836.1 hypothetical protein [Priestia megaterium]MED3808159.1 hypothetical protein [Priestia megaterium]